MVHQSKPISNPENVIDYFGRYAYKIDKIAITDYRIGKLENDFVYFKIKNYKTKKNETMPLHAIEFIRRFLLHILPPRFMKIRYYGMCSNSNMKKYRNLIFEQLQRIEDYNFRWELYDYVKKDTHFVLRYFLGLNFNSCANCGKGTFKIIKGSITSYQPPPGIAV